MRLTSRRGLGLAAIATSAAGLAAAAAIAGPGAHRTPAFTPIGTYATGIVGGTSGETSAFARGRLYVTNSTGNSLDVVNASNPAAPVLERRVDLSPYGAGPNSVDVSRNGVVAVAVEAQVKTDPGKVVFLRADGTFLATATVGSLPDMVMFSRRGELVVANEGEPSGYSGLGVDPAGSVSVVSTEGILGGRAPGVRTVSFAAFNVGGPRNAQLPEGIRLNGPGATVEQDLEPEYVTLDRDGRTAHVTLQEANAIAEIDLRAARVTRIVALGWKDHSVAGNGLDPSDRDGANIIGTWPVRGLYMPDAIAGFSVRGRGYLITANEGDGRDWPGVADEARVSSLTLDPVVFPNAAALKGNAQLGRLNVSRTDGTGPNGYTALYSFGARSATIWTTSGRRVWDSGDRIEQRVALEQPLFFNASNDNNTRDDRSDNKGPEPEGVAVGEIDDRTYAFVGLERTGGFMVFDVSRPDAPTLVQWANNRDYTRTPVGPDSGPEVLHFIDDDESPTGKPLVTVANEVSGTVTFYEAR